MTSTESNTSEARLVELFLNLVRIPSPSRREGAVAKLLQRELEAIPGQIDALEQEMASVQEQVSDPAFYQQPVQVTTQVLARLERLQKEMDALLERWAELEG